MGRRKEKQMLKKEKRLETCRSSIYTFLPFNACRSWHSSRMELIPTLVSTQDIYIYLEAIQTTVVIVSLYLQSLFGDGKPFSHW